MDLEGIIKHILCLRDDLTREDIIEMIREKIDDSHGLLTYEAAARLVASELGVTVPSSKSTRKMTIKSLVSGLNDVTVTGRILHVFPTQSFNRSDGTTGLIKRLLIADRSGIIKVIIWNHKVREFESRDIEPNMIVRFSHGYIREGLHGDIELNIGENGEIDVLERREVDHEIPSIDNLLERIESVERRKRRVNVAGLIEELSQRFSFKRNDGSEGAVKRISIRDYTGRINVVFWDNKADEAEGLERGGCLRIINAKVKDSISGGVELHIDNESHFEVIDSLSGLDFLLALPMRIRYVKDRSGTISLLARVIAIGTPREFKGRKGKTGTLLSLLIGDESGSIKLNLWGDRVAIKDKLKIGDVILVRDATISRRHKETTLNLNSRGSIDVNPALIRYLGGPSYIERTERISAIKEGEYVSIQGRLTSNPIIKEVTSRSGEKVKVAILEVSDGTGKVKVELWREKVNLAEGLSVNDSIRIRNVYAKLDSQNQLVLVSNTFTSLKKHMDR